MVGVEWNKSGFHSFCTRPHVLQGGSGSSDTAVQDLQTQVKSVITSDPQPFQFAASWSRFYPWPELFRDQFSTNCVYLKFHLSPNTKKFSHCKMIVVYKTANKNIKWASGESKTASNKCDTETLSPLSTNDTKDVSVGGATIDQRAG